MILTRTIKTSRIYYQKVVLWTRRSLICFYVKLQINCYVTRIQCCYLKMRKYSNNISYFNTIIVCDDVLYIPNIKTGWGETKCSLQFCWSTTLLLILQQSCLPVFIMVTNLLSWACDELKAMIILQSIAQIQIFAIQKVGICSDIPPYQLFRYDISAKSFSCAMLEGSLLDILMM